MWKLYKYNGRYIMGDLISSHKTESAAMKKKLRKNSHLNIPKKKRNQPDFISG